MKKTIIISLLVVSLVTGAVFMMGMAPCVNAANSSCTNKPEISSGAAYLTDSESGRVILAKAENERFEIASIVKVMTAILVFESVEHGDIKMDEMVSVSHNAAIQTGSELFIDEGDSYSIFDLLKGVIVVSANDAAVALAERVSGSESAFVSKMNERASELMMSNTLFVNSTGLPHGEQYSSAKDVNVMTRELLKHRDYYKFSSIWLEDYRHPSGRITQLANTNKLIRFYKGCDSGKTGYTDKAKFCLSASATRADMRVVATLLGAQESKLRFKEVSSLFDYAFSNYKRVVLMKNAEELSESIKLENATVNSIKPIISRQISVLIAKNDDLPKIEVLLKDNVVAPIKCGDQLGVVKVFVGDVLVDEVTAIAKDDIAKAGYWDYVKKIVSNNN